MSGPQVVPMETQASENAYIENLLADEFYEEARRACEISLESGEDVQRYEQLIRACFNLSQHHLCKKYADRIQLLLGSVVRERVSLEWAKSFGRKILAEGVSFGQSPIVPYAVSRALVNGNYFDDIFLSLTFSIQMYECSSNENEAYFAINQIGYCLSYIGGDPGNLGLELMEYSIGLGVSEPFHEDKMVHLMVGYHIVGNYHFAKVIRNTFRVQSCTLVYRLIHFVIDIAIEINLHGFDALDVKVRSIFEALGELEKCHAFVQVYGAVGLLTAYRGDRRGVLEALAKAKINADHCGSALSYMLYYRIEAMLYSLLGEYRSGLRSVEQYFEQSNKYGRPEYLDVSVQAIFEELQSQQSAS